MQKIIDINNGIIHEILFQINKDLNPNHSSAMDEKQIKELNFLQRKREYDHSKLRINNDFAFQKVNFIMQNNESGNVRNESQSCLFNSGVNNWKKSFSKSLDNSNLIENDKININDKYPFDADSNNEIKVLKNKKAVYINRNLLNSHSTPRSLKKFKQFKFEIRKKTSSKYRGVSKNGNKWQVLIMKNNNKYYISSYLSEEIAARIYDILAIKNFGIKASTNFIYNHIQIKKIKECKIDIKSENISDIIDQLIK